MIVTVTMNPAVDKTIQISQMEVGGLNRITAVEQDAGGKGINVSKTIKALGGETIATGFLGGTSGKWIADQLQELDIKTDFLFVDGQTRTNTKVAETGGRITELNESGVVIPPEKLTALLEKLDTYATPDTLFVLSGSVPQGVPKDIYATITQRVRQKGGQVLVDADGELFEKSLPAAPDMIKPNREELAAFLSLDAKTITQQELVAMAKKFLDTGISQ
ncbi:MAG: hexose kinase, partial [Eubacteriales bacterium]